MTGFYHARSDVTGALVQPNTHIMADHLQCNVTYSLDDRTVVFSISLSLVVSLISSPLSLVTLAFRIVFSSPIL